MYMCMLGTVRGSNKEVVENWQATVKQARRNPMDWLLGWNKN